MGVWRRFIHFYRKEICLSKAYWVGDELRCSVCETPVAICGLNNGTSKPYYIFKEFQKFESVIGGLIDEHTRERSDLASDQDGGWGTVHDYVQDTCRSLAILLMETGGKELEENGKECQSQDFGDNDMGIDVAS